MAMVLTVLLISTPANAEMTNGDTPVLTMELAVQVALTNNPSLIGARLLIDEAEARFTQAGLWSNPELEMDGRFDNSFNNEGEKSYGIGISQPITMSGRINAQKNVARVDVSRSMAEVADAERRITGEVLRAYTKILATGDQITLQEFLVGLNTKLLGVAQSALKRAEISASDVTAIMIARQQAQQALNALHVEYNSESLALKGLLGYLPEHPLSMAGTLTGVTSEPRADVTLEQALALRPDYIMAKWDVEQAEAERLLTRAERYDDWRVGAFYEQEQSVVDGAAPQEADQFLGVSLSIPLPFFNRQQGRLNETAARLTRTEDAVATLRLHIAHELADANARIVSLQAAVAGYMDEGLLAKAEANVAAVEDGYRKGLTDITAVIQSRQQFSELKATYIEAVRDYKLALIDLQIAVGNFPSTIQLSGPDQVKSHEKTN